MCIGTEKSSELSSLVRVSVKLKRFTKIKSSPLSGVGCFDLGNSKFYVSKDDV